MATKTIIEQVGRADATGYAESDWSECDNFPTLEHARAYAGYKCRQHVATPYRIVETTHRQRVTRYRDLAEAELADYIAEGIDVDAPVFVVEFVPEWLLR